MSTPVPPRARTAAPASPIAATRHRPLAAAVDETGTRFFYADPLQLVAVPGPESRPRPRSSSST